MNKSKSKILAVFIGAGLGLLGCAAEQNSVESLSTACANGNGKACFQAGKILYAGIEVPQDIKAANELFLKGCEYPLPKECTNATYFVTSKHFGNSPDRDLANKMNKMVFQANERLCKENEFEACYNLGISYYNGRSTEKDPLKGLSILENACESSFAKACDYLGRFYRNKKAEHYDAEKSKAYFNKAFESFGKGCEDNKWRDCNGLAHMYYSGRATEMDKKTAAFYFDKACVEEEPVSCSASTRYFKYGENPEKLALRAAEILQTGCENDSPTTCDKLGYVKIDDHGFLVELKIANSFYEKHCNKGSAGACFALGRMTMLGINTEMNMEKAERLFEKGCKGGNAVSCSTIAMMPSSMILSYQNNLGYTDYSKSIKFYGKACELGHKDSCAAVGKVRKSQAKEIEEDEAQKARQKAN